MLPGILSFTFPDRKMLVLKNFEKPGILTQNLEKDLLFKMTFPPKKSYLRLCHIFIINPNTASKPNLPGISLHLPGKYMEFSVTREVGTLKNMHMLHTHIDTSIH